MITITAAVIAATAPDARSDWAPVYELFIQLYYVYMLEPMLAPKLYEVYYALQSVPVLQLIAVLKVVFLATQILTLYSVF